MKNLFNLAENLSRIFGRATQREIGYSVRCVIFSLAILLFSLAKRSIRLYHLLADAQQRNMRRTGRSRFRIHSHSTRLVKA